MVSISVSMSTELFKKLDDHAESTKRSVSWVVQRAVEKYLDENSDDSK